MVSVYDLVVRPHRNYCPSGGQPSGMPRTRYRWICLQLSGARSMDNEGVRVITGLNTVVSISLCLYCL